MGRRKACRPAPPIGSGSTSPMAPTGSATIRIGSCRPWESSTCTSLARALTNACGRCSAPTRASTRAWPESRSRSGRRTRAACGWSATSTAGTGASCRCARSAHRGVGLFVPGIGPGELYKYEVLGADGKLRVKADPLSFSQQVRPETASRVWDIGSNEGWTDGLGWPTAPAARIGHQCRSTRSTWVPGGAMPTAAGSDIGRPPSSWRSTAIGSASPTSSCCRWPSIRSTARGATRSPATTRPPPASAPWMTSAPWSTRCTTRESG